MMLINMLWKTFIIWESKKYSCLSDSRDKFWMTNQRKKNHQLLKEQLFNQPNFFHLARFQQQFLSHHRSPSGIQLPLMRCAGIQNRIHTCHRFLALTASRTRNALICKNAHFHQFHMYTLGVNNCGLHGLFDIKLTLLNQHRKRHSYYFTSTTFYKHI